MSDTHGASPFDFSYKEFSAWYRTNEAARFQPALESFTRLLGEWLQRELSDSDLLRIRISAGRVKGLNRTWSKMLGDKYVKKIANLAEIPVVIDDIVGVRVTCNNSSDLQRVRDLLETLPAASFDSSLETGSNYEWLSVVPNSEKTYVDDPKPSGYRAYHTNLTSLLPSPGAWVPIVCELQVRTLLQDSWGELTHEDTYKAGVSLPPLAILLAKRMANLLAGIDELAQDLRDELDRIEQELLEKGVSDDIPAVPEMKIRSELMDTPFRAALMKEASRVVTGLTKQSTLADAAQKVRSSFSEADLTSWGGFGTFGELVRQSVPGAQIISTPPGFVVPPGMAYVGPEDSTLPALVMRLRAKDRTLPLWDSKNMSRFLDLAAEALGQRSFVELGLSDEGETATTATLNLLTKRIRDKSLEDGMPLGRQGINYFFRMLQYSDSIRPGTSSKEIAERISKCIVDRVEGFGYPVTASDKGDIDSWLGITDVDS